MFFRCLVMFEMLFAKNLPPIQSFIEKTSFLFDDPCPQTAKIMSRGSLPIIIRSLLDHHLIAINTSLVDHHWMFIISFIIKSFSNHYSIIIRTPLDHNRIIIRSLSHHYHIVVTSSSDPYQIIIKLPFINQP